MGKVFAWGWKKMVLTATEAKEGLIQLVKVTSGLEGLDSQPEHFPINLWTTGKCCKMLRIRCREGNDSGRQIRGSSVA